MGKNTQSQKTGSSNVLTPKISREFSSGGVVFKKDINGALWLVRKTMSSKLFPEEHWMLAKGWIDEGEKPEDTAVREVKEETGVEAKIVKKIETIKYFYKHPERGDVFKFVTFYLMEYIRNLPGGFDNETSEVAWLNFEEAKKRLSFSGEKQILAKAYKLLASLA